MSDEINDQETPIQVPLDKATSAEFPVEVESQKELQSGNESLTGEEKADESPDTLSAPAVDAELHSTDDASTDVKSATGDGPVVESHLQLTDVQSIVSAEVEKLLARMGDLQESFDSKLRYDAKKDAIIDRQHAELSRYRDGLVDKVTMQMVADIIGEIDSAEKLAKFYDSAEVNETNFRKLQKALRDVAASLCDVLDKHGVFYYKSKPGAAFDPKRQRAMKTTETSDNALDKTVKETLRSGFERELDAQNEDVRRMKVVRPEMVDVFVFKPRLESVEPESVSAAVATTEAERPVEEKSADVEPPENTPLAN